MEYRSYTIELLNQFGIHKRYKGFEYIISSINYIHQNEKNFTPVTKILYVEIAKEHNTSSLCVEKDMRTVIKNIWTQENNHEFIIKIFGEFYLNQRPTNIEFLMLLYNYIKLQLDYSVINYVKDSTCICPTTGAACEFCKDFVVETINKLRKLEHDYFVNKVH